MSVLSDSCALMQSQPEYLKFGMAGWCRGLLLAFCLSGCAVEPATQAVLDAYNINRSEEAASSSAAGLNPAFSYLRLQIDAREVFMALGYVDHLPDGPVQVWYSGEGDVLRLREGRVIGVTMKSGTNWSNVSFAQLPAWDRVEDRATFERVRDVSPGYRYGIKEKMSIRRIPPPDDTRLQLIPAATLDWFEETAQGDAELPPARYAVGTEAGGGVRRVVYAEQCLSREYCFSWQSWPSSGKGAN